MLEVTDKIIAYETGELDTVQTLELFGDLIKSGLAWQLQGSYGRAAKRLIEAGFITPQGEINWEQVRLTLEKED